jgi:hypothetical protein
MDRHQMVSHVDEEQQILIEMYGEQNDDQVRSIQILSQFDHYYVIEWQIGTS